MEDKTISQLNNFGTIYQYSSGDNATLVLNGPVDTVRPAETAGRDLSCCSEQEQALAVYVPDAVRRAVVIGRLAQVRSARDLAFKVVATLHEEPCIDRYVVVKKEFIDTLMPFAVNFTEGTSTNNIREQINKMLEQNKWRR